MKISVLSERHVVLPSPAKINTFLHVYQLREDGYHDLETYFQLIDLHDDIDIELTDDKQLIVENDSIAVHMTADLCYKAAKCLWNENSDYGIYIKVTKRIPDGAGLAGGSSNAATVLIGLNQMLKCGYSNVDLQRIGLTLGSDVPIFIYGHSCFASGRGEVFSVIDSDLSLQNQNVIVIKPRIKVSTKEIFASKYLTKRCKKSKIHRTQIQIGDNDFLSVVLTNNQLLCEFKEQIEQYVKVYLTGTGSCFYANVDDSKKAVKLISELPNVEMVYAVNCIDVSPLLGFKIGEWPSG